MLDASPARLTKMGRVVIEAGSISVERFEASGATCRDIAALAAAWAIGELQRELVATLQSPGNSRICVD